MAYKGKFNDVITELNRNTKTGYDAALFEVENFSMNKDDVLADSLRLLLAKKYNNSIE